MHLRKLFAVVFASICLAWGAAAQNAPDAGTPSTKAAKKKSSKSTKKGKKAEQPPPPPSPDVDEATRKALESMGAPAAAPDAGTPAQAAPAPAVAPEAAPPPAPEAQAAPADDEPPTLTHKPVTTAKKGKPLLVTAHASDPSGVFGPVLYLRKKGMPAADFIPLRMIASKTGTPGEYSVDIPAALVSVDALEYYIEAWDNAGNGPARAGSPESPLPIKVEEEKKIVKVEPPPPPKVEVKPKGAPPAITHTAVTQATKGQSIELGARLVGDTGVSGATVMFRHVGEKDYKALPMGNIGGDDYTATIPDRMVTGDIQYYVEAFDKYGNGPGRSGAPNVPYTIKVVEPRVGESVTAAGKGTAGPHIVKAPFSPNPGRAAGWLLMGTFVGGLVFAGGEAYGSWSANNAYTHTFTYEGRLDQGLLSKANAYGSRAKTAAIISGISLVGGIALLIIFPEHPDTIVVGSGGDVGVRF